MYLRLNFVRVNDHMPIFFGIIGLDSIYFIESVLDIINGEFLMR